MAAAAVVLRAPAVASTALETARAPNAHHTKLSAQLRAPPRPTSTSAFRGAACSRRDAPGALPRQGVSVVSKAAAGSPAPMAPGPKKKDQQYPWWFALPLSPITKRTTLREEVVRRTVWTFDQLQGTLAVLVNVRMTVVALKGGGLWVYNPVAPTPECVRQMRELEAQYGPVKYVVLGTYAVEHKVYLGPFVRKFKQAQVWVAPNQWSYPINLPIGFLGIFPRKANIIPEDSSDLPWADEFEHAILGPIDIGLGPFVEVAFNHKPSGTLILTDSLVEVPTTPPAICQVDPYPLLYHARSNFSEDLTDTPAERARGWAKTVLFAFYLRPVPVDLVKTIPTFQNWCSKESFPAFEGFFPFEWPEGKEGYRASFDRLANRLLVPPILENFILNRGPSTVKTWADQVATFKFKRIIPAHFKAPIAASPREFRGAIEVAVQNSTRTPEMRAAAAAAAPGGISAGFLRRLPGVRQPIAGLPDQDMVILREIDEFFVQKGVSPPRGKLTE